MIIVARAERWLTPKRKGKAADESEDGSDGADDGPAAGSGDVLTSYIESPEPNTTLVLVAADINRTTTRAVVADRPTSPGHREAYAARCKPPHPHSERRDER